MRYKITGKVRNGRWDNIKGEWELARVTRFFPSKQEAEKYFNDKIVIGTLWVHDDFHRAKYRGAKENEYHILELKNQSWPLGANA